MINLNFKIEHKNGEMHLTMNRIETVCKKSELEFMAEFLCAIDKWSQQSNGRLETGPITIESRKVQ